MNTISKASCDEAREILGLKHVIDCGQVCRALQQTPPLAEPGIRFSKGLMSEKAKKNMAGENWKLVYIPISNSLMAVLRAIGSDRNSQPCLDPSLTWWLSEDQGRLANRRIKPGYRLMNFVNQFWGMEWENQEEEIAKIKRVRAEEQAVVIACIANFLVFKERLLECWCHWGQASDFFGGLRRHVYVGRFDEEGLVISRYWDNRPNPCLSVVVEQEPDL